MKTKHDNGCWQTLSPSSSFYLDVDYALARQNDFFCIVAYFILPIFLVKFVMDIEKHTDH